MPAANYNGPQCPHCSVTLAADALESGLRICAACDKTFEATAFQPPELRVVAPEIVGVGPAEGSACANHARNAAVASCQRCGLFICSLCEMNTGTGTYCPSCFDRARTENTFQVGAKRYRNYTSFGVISILSGIFIWFLCVPLGAIAVYYGVKDIRQRRERGASVFAAILVIIVGLGQVAGGVGILGFFIYSLFR
jgi:hypothetical protein